MNSGADQAIASSAPLSGVRVLVTRAPAQAAALAEPLRALGAEVVVAPAIQLTPCDTPELDTWLRTGQVFDWLVFTSSNAVDAFAARLLALELTPHDLRVTHVAAIGAATTRRVEQFGLPVELIPPQAVAESLADALVSHGVAGADILLPVARAARDVLPTRLRAAGAHVHVAPVYDTVSGIAPDHVADAALADIITVASPSAVDGLATLAGTWQRNPALVCIGPITAERARAVGWRTVLVAEDASVTGLIAAVHAAAAARAGHTPARGSHTSHASHADSTQVGVHA